jgi:hypothetical protein
MSSIDDIPTRPPQGQDFGQAFNYNAWVPNTQVELCEVPWNSDYRDIVKFPTRAALDAYLDSSAAAPFSIQRMTYARTNDPIRVNVPFNKVYGYNYIRVTNPAQPITGTVYQNGKQVQIPDTPKSFYYFIVDVRYLAPNTTEIVVQLDVWQTFGFDIKFGNCYVERGHVGIANTKAMDNNGLDYLTVPEGFDLGSDYMPRMQYIHNIMFRPNDLATTDANQPYVLIVSTTSLVGSFGTEADPKLNTSSGNSAESLPNGAEQWIFKRIIDFENFMLYMSIYPWVSQGIVSITLVPPFDLDPASAPFYPNSDSGSGAPMYTLDPHGNYDYTVTETISMKDDWREDARNNLLPDRYKHLDKFLTSPYVMLELTTYHGQPIVLKPELMSGEGIDIYSTLHLAQPNPQLTLIPKNYGVLSDDIPPHDNFFQASGEFFDLATSISNFPTFSMVNNSYLAFMASNAHRIAFSYQSAAWTEQRALRGNDVSMMQANQSIDNMWQQQNIAMQAGMAQTDLRNQTTGLSTAINMGSGAINDIGHGNVGKGILDPLTAVGNAAVSMNQNTQSNAIANNASLSSTSANSGLSSYMRDTNKSYSDFAARGDYANEIAGINARVQDTKLLQPTTSGQVGGEVALLVAYGWKLHAKVKTINTNAMHNIGEFWLRYGYAINRFTTPPNDLRCMNKFTYWKMKETYITAWKCPESYKQAIRGIFEKGVTVWTNPSDIGTIDIGTNEPLTGIAL